MRSAFNDPFANYGEGMRQTGQVETTGAINPTGVTSL
jgi:hypothetical protein